MFSPAYSSMVHKMRDQAKVLQTARNAGFTLEEHADSLLNDPDLNVKQSEDQESKNFAKFLNCCHQVIEMNTT
jgi:hypothetical protein